jgi:hypothetical protein
MTKAALVVLADTESRDGLGRVVNAMITAKELKESGDEVALLFDGAGTRWVAALSEGEHRYHSLFEDVRDRIVGACAYCARAFGVRDEVEAAEIALLDDFEEHPSLRSYLADGYHVLTF